MKSVTLRNLIFFQFKVEVTMVTDVEQKLYTRRHFYAEWSSQRDESSVATEHSDGVFNAPL